MPNIISVVVTGIEYCMKSLRLKKDTTLHQDKSHYIRYISTSLAFSRQMSHGQGMVKVCFLLSPFPMKNFIILQKMGTSYAI